MEQTGIELAEGTLDEFLDRLLESCSKEDLADFQEGYWVDHWTYNTDLLEQYMAVYPDKMFDLLFNDCGYTYYDNCEMVLPREKKYVLTENGVRQLGSLERVSLKEKMIKERSSEPNKVRTDYGKGEVYRCTLASKIICLLVNKIASLDPEGVGVEMEANKPGWCDALNGLPAILGSSINESAEIRRLALFMLDAIGTGEVDKGMKVKVPEELYDFFVQVYDLLDKGADGFEYWDLSCRAKENFRERTLFGVSGKEREIDLVALSRFLEMASKKVDKGLERAFNSEEDVYYTYFINEVVDYELIKDGEGETVRDKNGYAYVKALKFRQRPIPYFLEGPVHVLRLEKDAGKAKRLYNAIKNTGLYDEKLCMYKVNDNIMDETKEIGRQNVFPRGWLENEAVFLHMEYKYFLELLRCGLYDEFFECFKKALIPFLDPKVYGRSILENSSFIASTVHPDEKVHGNGFVSRLTGASAEFLNMWLWMTAGQKPFYVDKKGRLCLEFRPILPEWLFTREAAEINLYGETNWFSLTLPANTFAFCFLGKTLVVYHNVSRKDTFGEAPAIINRIVIRKGEETVNLDGSVVPAPYSEDVRDGKVDMIEVFLC